MIPDSFIEELKYRLDANDVISHYVKLKRSGKGYIGLCPFHSEKTGSFFVYPESRSFYCFGCGAGGDLVTFVRMAEHLSYMEALALLADKVGLKLPENTDDDKIANARKRNYEANREAARFFYSQLSTDEAKKLCIPYIQKRKLTPETVKKFGLGYAPSGWDSLKKHLLSKGFNENELFEFDLVKRGSKGNTYDTFRNRLMFPIIDVRGMVVGFSGRALTDEIKPKYYNTNDTLAFKKSRNLFAMNYTKATKANNIIVCEGNIDVVSLHQAGFDNAVATLGTALSEEHVRMLSSYKPEVVLSYDSDAPGQKATSRAIALANEVGLKIRVLEIKGAKDPDEFINKFGRDRFQNLLDGSSSATEYEITKIKKKYDIATLDGKTSFMKDFCVLMSKLESPIESDIFITKISRELEISKDAINAEVSSLKRKNVKAKQKQEEKNLRVFASNPRGSNYDPQREQNLRYALAEDRLITALLLNPDYGKLVVEKISHEEFVTDSNRVIFKAICDRINKDNPFGIDFLSQELEIGSINKLASLIADSKGKSYTKDDILEFIKVIKEKGMRASEEEIAKMDSNDIKSYIENLAKNKKIEGA